MLLQFFHISKQMNMRLIKLRFRAAAVHLFISIVAAGCAAYLVFFLLYPKPFNITSGGNDLFLLLLSVDLVMGPLLTFAVISPNKTRAVLAKDLAVIGALQLAALLYGLTTVYAVRPVYLVHEVDRVQVVTAADVDEVELRSAMPEFQRLPLFGVRLIGVRQPLDGDEKLAAIEQAMAGGKDVSMRPGWWIPIDAAYRKSMAMRGQDLDRVMTKNPGAAAHIEPLLREQQLRAKDIVLFPLMARAPDWSILVDQRTWDIVGYVPVDGF